MSKRDLITKDFALYVVHYFASMQTWSKNEILSEIDRTIKEAKEDIVRCKDCVCWAGNEYWENRASHGKCCCPDVKISMGGVLFTKPDDYCSHGERKEK